MAGKGQPQRARVFREALQLEIAAAVDDNDPRSLRRVARKLLAVACEGDVSAIKEIADRLDGKVPQAHVGDDECDPIRLTADEPTDEQRVKALAAFLDRTGGKLLFNQD